MKKLVGKSRFKDWTDLKKRTEKTKMPDGVTYNRPLLLRARRAWDSLSTFRMERRRNINYTFGDQWGDLVWDGCRWVTERTRLAEKDGQPPLQNNHIVKIERALCGLYAKSQNMPLCFAREENSQEKSEMMTKALQTNWDRNSEKELLTSELSEMIVGGLPVVTEEWAVQDGIDDSYTYIVNPDYFMYESKGGDPRMWDVSLVGEIRDYTFNELCAVHAKTDNDIAQLASVYKDAIEGKWPIDRQLQREPESFYWPKENLCRTYRIWTQEQRVRYRCVDLMDESTPLYKIERSDLKMVQAKNEARKRTFHDFYMSQGDDDATAWSRAESEAPLITYERFTDLFWKLTVLTPDGVVIDEQESPYEHNSHPYVFRPHQLVAGRIHPYISTIIDQQRYVNRLITLNDMYTRSMIKGLKMIPKTLLGDLSPAEFARQAVELNGWVFYEPDPRNPNAVPQVISQHASDLGVAEMVQLQVNWMNDISSMSDALQGKTPRSGTPASRYLLETENSTTAIASLLSKFTYFERDLAKKKMKVIHQYYQQGRTVAAHTPNGYVEYSDYDPKEVQDIEFDVNIRESVDNPVYRMMMNDMIQQMWQAGAINAEQMLEMSYLPGSQSLLQKIKAAREQAEAAQMQAQQAQQGMQASGGNAPSADGQVQGGQYIDQDEPMGNKVTVNKVQQILQERNAPV